MNNLRGIVGVVEKANLDAQRERDLRRRWLAVEGGADPEEALSALIKSEDARRATTTKPAFRERFLAASKKPDELREQRQPTPDAILGEGMIYPRQTGIIHSEHGIGKTSVAIQGTVAWSQGLPLFDVIPARPGGVRVGLIELEDDDWVVDERLAVICDETGADFEKVRENVRIVCPPFLDDDVDLLLDEVQDTIIEWAQTHTLDLILIDNLTDAHTGDERDLRPVARAMLRIARDCGAGVIANHHDRKSPAGARGNTGGKSAVRGDTRLPGKARLQIQLSRVGDRIRMDFHKTSHQAEPAPIHLKRNDSGTLAVTDPPLKPIEKAAERRERMREAVQQAGEKGITPKDLAELLQVSEKTISEYGKWLESKGIKKTGTTSATRYRLRKDETPSEEVPKMVQGKL